MTAAIFAFRKIFNSEVKKLLLMSANKSPIPYFDTLAEMPNPFKEPVSSWTISCQTLPPTPCSIISTPVNLFTATRGSPDTFSTYRREVEHFLHWCWLIAHKSLAQIVREDIETYVEFTKQPPATWIGEKNVSRLVDKNGERVPNPTGGPMSASVVNMWPLRLRYRVF